MAEGTNSDFDIDKVLPLFLENKNLLLKKKQLSQALGISLPEITLRSRLLDNQQITLHGYYQHDLLTWQGQNESSAVSFEKLADLLDGIKLNNLGDNYALRPSHDLEKGHKEKVRNLAQSSLSDELQNYPPTPIKFNLPECPNLFHGRKEELQKMSNYFFPTDPRHQRYKVICVSGFSGIGKTELVREFVTSSLQDYNIAWLSGQDDLALHRHLVEFASKVFNTKDEICYKLDFPRLVECILELIADTTKKTSRQWAIVIDDVKKGNSYFNTLITALEKYCILVLVTTPDINNTGLLQSPNIEAFRITTGLQEKDALEFAFSQLSLSPCQEIEEKDAIIKLCSTTLGGHPLAICMSINYIKQQRLDSPMGESYGILHFIDDLAKLDSIRNQEGNVLDEGAGCKFIDSILKMALPKFSKPGTFHCLVILSMFLSENVPYKFLEDILSSDKSIDVEACIRELNNYGLISCNNSFITTHALVQFASKKQFNNTETSQETKAQIVQAVIHWIRNVKTSDLNRKNAIHLTTLWKNVVILAGDSNLVSENQGVRKIIFEKLRDVSALLEACMESMQALNYANESFKRMSEEALEPSNKNKNTLVMKGLIYQSLIHLGKYDEAVQGLTPLFHEMSQSYGVDDLDTLSIGNDLARALHCSGKHDEGLILSLRVLNSRQEILGFGHKDTIMVMHNIAIFLSDPDLSFKMFADALAIHKVIYDLKLRHTKHFDEESLFCTRFEMAFCKVQQAKGMSKIEDDGGRRKDLLQNAKMELEVIRDNSTLDADHKEMLRVQHYLAEAMNELGDEWDMDMALEIAMKVLSLRTEVLGEDHKETMRTQKLVDSFGFMSTIESLASLVDDDAIIKIEQQSTDSPTGRAIYFGVMQPTSFFTGRDAEVQQLSELFLNKSPPKIVVISGMGGQGKTELCRQFIQTLKDKDYPPSLIWLSGANATNLTSSIVQLAQYLQIPTTIEARPILLPQLLIQVSDSILLSNSSSNGWLVVIDNVDDVYSEFRQVVDLLVGQGGFLLVTTRRMDVLSGEAKQMKLDFMKGSEAYSLVQKCLNPPPTAEDSHNLCAELGNHVLSLRQAVAYINFKQIENSTFYGVQDYLADIVKDVTVLNHSHFDSNYNGTIFGIVNESFNTIHANHGRLGKRATELMETLCLVRPDGISVECLKKFQTIVDEGLDKPSRLQAMNEDDLHQTLLLLKKYSLISYNDRASLSIHRLVQKVAKCQYGSEANRTILTTIQPEKCSKEELQQVIHMLEQADIEIVVECPTLPNRIFVRMHHLSLVLELKPFAVKNHQLLAKVLGSVDKHTLEMEHNIGIALKESGDYEAALLKYQQVLETKRRILGKEHASTLATESELALTYYRLKKFEEALEWNEQVLEYQLRVLGSEHEDTMITRNNMALVMKDLGQTDDALTLFNQVLDWRMENQGRSHPDALATRLNMATILLGKGQVEEAHEELEAILGLSEDILGEEHADTLLTKGWLASSLWQLGRRDDALKMKRKVLALQEKVLGPNHPLTIITRRIVSEWEESLSHLGSPLSKIGNISKKDIGLELGEHLGCGAIPKINQASKISKSANYSLEVPRLAEEDFQTNNVDFFGEFCTYINSKTNPLFPNSSVSKPEFDFTDPEVVAVSFPNFKGTINWSKKVCRGRRYRRLCSSLAVSEEILSRIPCTVILFFSPKPPKVLLHQSITTVTETTCMKEMETFFKNHFPKVAIRVIAFVNKIVVGSLDWSLLRRLMNQSFDFNIVIDNQRNIVSASMDGESSTTAATDNLKLRQYTNEHFQAFETLSPPKTMNGNIPIKVGIFDSGADLTKLNHSTKIKPIMLRCYIKDRPPDEAQVREDPCSDTSTFRHGTKVAYVLDKTSYPGTEIYCFSVLDENDKADEVAVLFALDSAISNGIQIVNCSFNLEASELSSGRDLTLLLNAFAEANKQHGILPVFSAGNHTPPTTFVLPPAECGISVGSHRLGGDCRWSKFSCGQCSADIATAGEGLILFDNNPVIESGTSYDESTNGTSFAAPAISGFLTYLLHLSDIYKRPEVIKKLFDDTAVKIPCKRWRCTGWSQVGCPKKFEVALAYQEAQDLISRNEILPVYPQVVPNNNDFNDDIFMEVDD